MLLSVLQESLIFTGKTYLKWENKVHQCEELVVLIKMDIYFTIFGAPNKKL